MPNATFLEADEESPGLFVSNAPEQVGNGGGSAGWSFGSQPSKNLCKVKLDNHLLGPIPSRDRVFFWHISRFNQTTYWGILAEAPGGEATNIKGQIKALETSDIGAPGRCLADAQLFQTLEALNPDTVDLDSEAVVWSVEVAAAQTLGTPYSLIGAVIEFDLASTTEFTLRSVVTKEEGEWGSFDDDVAPLASNGGGSTGQHVRGYWEHAGIRLRAPFQLDCKFDGPPPAYQEFDICEASGPEATYYSATNSRAIGATGIDGSKENRAGYGADLDYEIKLKNTSTSIDGKAYIGMRNRGISPAKYFGAGRIDRPLLATPKKLKPIPGSYTSTDENYGLRGYDLTSVYPASSPTGFIVVPKNTSELIAGIRVTTAAAAGTPVNVLVSRDGVWPQPLEESQ